VRRVAGPCALLAAFASASLLASSAPARNVAAPPTKVKGVLTAAIGLGNPGFAEGKLSNPHGFSTDVARAVARQMRLKIRFVDYPFQRLFVPGAKPYDAAFEFVTILPGRKRWVDFSAPEYSSHQGVLVAKDITGAVTLARLRTLQVCAKTETTGDAYVQDVLKPNGLVLEYPTAGAALKALSKSICDAFVFDLPALIAAKRESPSRYGAIAGRVGAAEKIGVVLPKGSKLRPAMNKAIESLRRDGTIRKIEVQNFGLAWESTPPIR
jgi:polar amino acid transport system substrate-binding protein